MSACIYVYVCDSCVLRVNVSNLFILTIILFNSNLFEKNSHTIGFFDFFLIALMTFVAVIIKEFGTYLNEYID